MPKSNQLSLNAYLVAAEKSWDRKEGCQVTHLHIGVAFEFEFGTHSVATEFEGIFVNSLKNLHVSLGL